MACASFHGTRGVGTTPFAVSPLIDAKWPVRRPMDPASEWWTAEGRSGAPTVDVANVCGHQTGSTCLPCGGACRGPTPAVPSSLQLRSFNDNYITSSIFAGPGASLARPGPPR